MQTTLNAIRLHSPCSSGWNKLLKTLNKTKADDEPVDFRTILESNGLDDAIWCLRTLDCKEVRLFAVFCARQGQHLLADERSLNTIDVAEKFAHGEATECELREAHAAAHAAAHAVYASAQAAHAAHAAYSAAYAAYASAQSADAAYSAAYAAYAAAHAAAYAAVYAAAYSAAYAVYAAAAHAADADAAAHAADADAAADAADAAYAAAKKEQEKEFIRLFC